MLSCANIWTLVEANYHGSHHSVMLGVCRCHTGTERALIPAMNAGPVHTVMTADRRVPQHLGQTGRTAGRHQRAHIRVYNQLVGTMRLAVTNVPADSCPWKDDIWNRAWIAVRRPRFFATEMEDRFCCALPSLVQLHLPLILALHRLDQIALRRSTPSSSHFSTAFVLRCVSLLTYAQMATRVSGS